MRCIYTNKHNNRYMKMKQEQAISPIESLVFRKGTQEASVVTDGLHFATYTAKGRQLHKSLTSAIGHLEAQGYKIMVDLWTQSK